MKVSRLGMSITLFIVGSMARIASGQVLINEDFDVGPGCMYNYDADEFAVETGVLRVCTTDIEGGGRCEGAYEYALCGTNVDADFVLEVDVKVVNAPEYRAGIVYGWRNDGTCVPSYYNFLFNFYNNENIVTLMFNNGGCTYPSCWDNTFGFGRVPTRTLDYFYHVRIEVTGDQHRIYVDGELVIDTSHPNYAGGQIGLAASFNGCGEFDNLVVTQDVGCPDPELTILRAPALPASVAMGEIVIGDFDWNVYSGTTQPGTPVWINVYGWRDSSGNWVGPDPVVFYNGIPGVCPGFSEYDEPIVIAAPTAEDTYTLWAHAFPTLSEATAIQEFKNAVITADTNVAKLLGIVDVTGGTGQECLQWEDVSTNGRPGPTSMHAMAYDSAREVVLLFGGIIGPSYPDSHNETWEWSCTDGTWTRRDDLANSPPARYAHAMAYDSARQVVVLFGGSYYGAGDFDDTWEYNGISWTQQFPEGPVPSARRAHAMAYDTSRGVVVLFGGDNPAVNDTWEWNGTNWTDVSPAQPNRPPPRQFPAMVYDADCGAVLMFGGQDAARYNDTWAWDGMAWTDVTPPTGNPAPRYASGMSYDSVRQRTILFGGSGYGGNHLDDTWEFDWNCSAYGEWTQINAIARPSARPHTAMVFDTDCSKTVLFGGWASPTNHLNDTWIYPEVDNVDCNTNGIPDQCDIADGTSEDCNSNGEPDECEQDCNANGVPDECDISAGTSADCNSNGVPDECELADNDCNTNDVPDDCDIPGGTSADCNTNGIPDECECDFDDDRLIDDCDGDIDSDGVPNSEDVCDYTPTDLPPSLIEPDGSVLGDLDADCDVDLADYAIMAARFTGPRKQCP